MVRDSEQGSHFRAILWKFILICIPIRLALVYIAWIGLRLNRYNIARYVLGISGLIVGIGFMYFHLSGNRPLSRAGDKAWWNRIVHSLLYLGFGIRALMGNKDAYLFLLADVVYGANSFVIHHIGNGDFNKIFK
jgi:hypothetical protein